MTVSPFQIIKTMEVTRVEEISRLASVAPQNKSRTLSIVCQSDPACPMITF